MRRCDDTEEKKKTGGGQQSPREVVQKFAQNEAATGLAQLAADDFVHWVLRKQRERGEASKPDGGVGTEVATSFPQS